MDTLATPLSFLVNTLISLYTLAVLLRFVLQKLRADYYNPLSQLVIRATDPVMKPLHRVMPAWRGFDLAAILLMLVLQAINILLLALIQSRLGVLDPIQLPFYAALKIIHLSIMLFIFTILIQVIVSWLSPGNPNPVLGAIWQLNRPLLQPVRRLMPDLGGIDLSPMLVIIFLFFLNLLLQGIMAGLPLAMYG
ncbi:YggT family protein [Natronospira proteinivora]|uniref:YggT family protein n=1 Tax=Natronospira proteinivora TaxID=1807133 RepID=A0ABT1GEL7_9GAMM|nr:YggT family protein [Natronospira proteinivora]MCP1728392.1 YggT family protein [Natronospira proteinivora]